MQTYDALATAKTIAWLLGAAGLLILGLAAWSFLRMLRKKPKSEAALREILEKDGLFDPEFLGRAWTAEKIPSPNGGYSLAVHGLDGGSDRVAVFSHDITGNWLACLHYMKPFADSGWTVVAYDGRGHGESGRAHHSYGYFEKHDLGAVCDWALSRFDGSGGLVLHGVSLGAAVSLQFAGIDTRPDAVISDCAFSSAAEELEWRLRKVVRAGPGSKAVFAVTDFLARTIDHFSLRDSDSGAASLSSDADILFIHGSRDEFMPWKMSETMARTRRDACPANRTELILFKDAMHGQSRKSAIASYDRFVLSFADAATARRNGGASPVGGAADGATNGAFTEMPETQNPKKNPEKRNEEVPEGSS
ncbi:MAG: alpha/beta fold hydrolase [Rectinemataceae bacterium]